MPPVSGKPINLGKSSYCGNCGITFPHIPGSGIAHPVASDVRLRNRNPPFRRPDSGQQSKQPWAVLGLPQLILSASPSRLHRLFFPNPQSTDHGQTHRSRLRHDRLDARYGVHHHTRQHTQSTTEPTFCTYSSSQRSTQREKVQCPLDHLRAVQHDAFRQSNGPAYTAGEQ